MTCIFIHLFIYTNSLLDGSNASAKKSAHQPQQVPTPLLRIISVNMDNVPMQKALSLIALEGGFKLNYNRNRIPVNKKISVKMNNVPAINVLQKVLEKTDTELIITPGGQIGVIPRKKGQSSQGTIMGRVSENINNRRIPGVFIKVVGKGFSSLSDEKGEFKITNVPTGSYQIKFSAPGFKSVIKSVVVIGHQKAFPLNISMEVQLLRLRERIEVLRSSFHVNEQNPVSLVNVSSQEVCRAPGTIGCVSRVLRTIPGITSLADSTNELIARGGNPLENGFYIDNIEIPTINHLPSLSSSGGIYSAINPDLIQNIDFFSGGFSSDYGDHISSVTEITFREGNRDNFKGEINVNTMMGSGILEGPLVKGRGALLISFRKSWIDWLNDLIDELDSIPETFDSQIKVTIDMTPKQKINFLYFHGSGTFKNNIYERTVLEEAQYYQNTSGINWLANWNKKFFSNTSLSYSSLKRSAGEIIDLLKDRNKRWDIDDWERYLNLRNSNFLFFNNHNKLEFGFQLKHETAKSRYFIYPYMGSDGFILPGRNGNLKYQRTKFSLFFSYTSNPSKKLTSTLGLRADYSFTHDVFHISPRFSMSYRIHKDLSLSGGFGVFYQSFPLGYLSYTPGIKNLRDMKAIQYIVGLEYFPGAGIKLSLEVYNKEYRHLYINPDFPYALFSDWLLDQSVDNIYGPTAYFPRSPLNDEASGYCRGIELLIQKKLIRKFYGTLSATYFRSRYQDLSGTVRDRIFDNCYVINLLGVFKPNERWEFSARWTSMGGAPYTPIDYYKSMALLDWTLDQSKFHSFRYPSYQSLNLRINRRFDFAKSSLLFYLDILNVLDRDNVNFYFWESSTNQGRISKENQLPLFPVFGIRYEF